MGTSTHVEVAAFDVRGRRVGSLFEGSLGAGPHELLWQGMQLTLGIYFIRARTETATRILRVVWLGP